MYSQTVSEDQIKDKQNQQLRPYCKPAVFSKSLGEVVRGGPLSGGTDFQARRFP
jgi:hypothetical protein